MCSSDLINDVLSFAKIDAGRIEMTIADVGLHELLSGLEPLVQPLITQRSLRYHYEAVTSPVSVRVDPDKAQQVLLNLLSNAAKFTEPGGRITVWAKAKPNTVDVVVADTGRGIPTEKLESIFEPFVQIDAGKTRNTDGTGLGLAISRDLARAMKGEITVESEVGKGSVFTLILPR